MNGSRLYDFSLLQKADAKSTKAGISAVELMGNAAHASHLALRKSWLENSSFVPNRIFFLCGSGNNGGDGYALAWHLASDPVFGRIPVQIFQSSEPKTEAARFYAARIDSIGIPRASLESFFLEVELADGDLLVDALLGSGQRSPLRGTMLEVFRKIKEERTKRSLFLLSLDLPTGLSESRPARFVPAAPIRQVPIEGAKRKADAPEGKKNEEAVLPLPDAIHSYGLPKLATALHPDLALAQSKGQLLLEDFPIGFHPEAIPKTPFALARLPTEFGELLRSDLGHKYKAGHAFLLGGSTGMEGALLLSARAFFSAGGGILHCFVPEGSGKELLAAMPEIMLRPLSELPNALHELPSPGSVALGMGLSVRDFEKYRPLLVDFFLEACRQKDSEPPRFLFDAHATQLILDLQKDAPKDSLKNIILTPHSGEWKRLGGLAIKDTEGLKQAQSLALRLGCACLVKDAISVLLEPDCCTVFANPLGNLSVAGSGDILAGILSAILSRRGGADGGGRSELFRWQRQLCLAVGLHQAAARTQPNPSASELIAGIQKILQKRADKRT